MRIMEIFHLDDMTPGQRAEVLALRTESRMPAAAFGPGAGAGHPGGMRGTKPRRRPQGVSHPGAAVAIRSEDARTVTMRRVVV